MRMSFRRTPFCVWSWRTVSNTAIGATPIMANPSQVCFVVAAMSAMTPVRIMSAMTPVRIAGNVIVRQRPGTAKGVVFISLEDETGIANIVVMPDKFELFRTTIVSEPYLMVDGTLQNVDGVIHVKAGYFRGLEAFTASVPSHDFR